MDTQSIEKAVKKLTEYKNKTMWLKIEKIARGAIDAFIKEANIWYGNYAGSIAYLVDTQSTRTSKSWIITVSSPGLVTRDGESLPLVIFLEFGTGQPADITHPGKYGNELPIGVTAGTWSITHSQTYQKWMDSGGAEYSKAGDRSQYRYNHEAVRAVFHGMEKMRKYVERYKGEST